MMKQLRTSIFTSLLLILSLPGQAQIPGMTSWVSNAANQTEIELRMHDRTINQGYSLVEVSFTMSAARCALTDEVRIFIYQNDGSGSYGTQRYAVSFDPGPGTVPIATSEMTRILVVSSGSTEPIYARAVIRGVLPADDFVLTTPDCITSIVTTDAYDPNEGIIDASPITSGTTHLGLLINNDLDYYPVSISSGNQNLVVSISYLNDYRTTESNLDLDLYLVNGAGTIASSTSSATSTSSPITETIDEVLDPGTYYIVVRPKSVDPNRNFYTLNWNTYAPPDYQISGYVRDAETNDIRHVNLVGLPGSPVTDVDGLYSINVEPGWSGTATPVLAGYTFIPVSRTYTDVQDAHLNDNYIATLDQFTISGRITNGTGAGESGVTLNGFPDAVVSDADGYYSATIPYNWSGTIIPFSPSFVFSPLSNTYTQVRANTPDQDYTSSPRTYDLYGNVITPTGTPLEGVRMNGFPETVLTNHIGSYSGAVEPGWSGTITPSLEAYTFDPVSVSLGNVATTQQIPDFRGTLNTYTISGNISLLGSGALSGVLLSGLPGDPLTDASGNYTATVDHGWSGTVTPTLEGYTFDPASTIYSSVTSTQSQDYTGTLNTFEISGTIRDDGNFNVPSVTLSGLPGDPVTDGNGYYSVMVDHGWSGTVTPILTGYTFDPVSIVYSNVTSAQSQNYTATANIYTIDGYVRTGGGAGIEGVTMSGLGGAITDAAGYYSGNAQYNINYTVTPFLNGYTFTPASTSYSPVTGDENTDYTGIPGPYLNLSQRFIFFTGEAGANDQVDVSSNVDWTVSCPASWITCTPAAGSDNGSFTITANAANTGTESRDATVTVLGEGLTEEISVSQAGSGPSLEVSTTTVDLGSDATSSSSLTITSNIAWTVSETADWLSVAPASGTGNGSLTITADLANEAIGSRSTTVTVAGSGITHSIDVTQAGTTNILEVSSTNVSLAAGVGAGQTVAITSNIAWTASETADWLTVSPVSGTNDGVITISAATTNESLDPRIALVTVSGEAITHNIEVTQAGAANILEVSSTSVSFGAGVGAGQTVAITSNIAWTASESVDWLTVSPVSGSNDGVITISAATANEEVSDRSTTVTVAGSGISHNIEVTQSGGEPSLGLGAPSGNLAATAGSSLTLNLYSNIAWTASLDVSWLSLSPASGTGNQVLTITADSANLEEIERIGTLSVDGGGMNRTITITQDGTDYTAVSPFEELKLELYPNPSMDYVYLQSSMEVPEELSIKVLSSTGQVLSEMQQPRLTPGEPVQIDLSTYPTGQYLIQISSDHIQTVYKIIKAQ